MWLIIFGSLQKQVKEGIDAVIVDSVLAIRKGLTGASQNLETGGAEVAVRNHGQTNGGEAAVAVTNGGGNEVSE